MNSVNRATKKWLVLAVAFCLMALSACGFHLRGAGQDLSAMGALYIGSANAYSNVTKDFKRILEASNAQLVEEPKNAKYRVQILKEETNRRVLSYSSSGRPLEYEVTLGVRFRVTDAIGEDKIPENTITQTRSYLFDETNVLGKRNEEDRLVSDMRRAVVQQLVRRLLSFDKTGKS